MIPVHVGQVRICCFSGQNSRIAQKSVQITVFQFGSFFLKVIIAGWDPPVQFPDKAVIAAICRNRTFSGYGKRVAATIPGYDTNKLLISMAVIQFQLKIAYLLEEIRGFLKRRTCKDFCYNKISVLRLIFIFDGHLGDCFHIDDRPFRVRRITKVCAT